MHPTCRAAHLSPTILSRSCKIKIFSKPKATQSRILETRAQSSLQPPQNASMSALKTLQAAIQRGRSLPSAPPACRPPTRSTSQPPCLAGLHVEELEYQAEDDATHSQAWVPLRIVKQPNTPPPSAQDKLPAIIFIHCTGSNMNSLAYKQAQYSRRGYLTAAIDTRYHGARTDPNLPYQDALVKAWEESIERPFLLDVLWDLQRLLDLLETRLDVDSQRIGVAGESLGGMISWLLAAADNRIAAAAPICGVQSFRYALENDKYHDRVGSIPLVFEAASKSLGKGGKVDREVVRAVWDKIMPGLLSEPKESGYDAEQSLCLIAPRPLLIVNGEIDGKTHLEGVKPAVEAARKAYKASGAPDAALEFYVEKGVGHDFTPTMWKKVDDFMDKYLLNK